MAIPLCQDADKRLVKHYLNLWQVFGAMGHLSSILSVSQIAPAVRLRWLIYCNIQFIWLTSKHNFNQIRPTSFKAVSQSGFEVLTLTDTYCGDTHRV